MIRRSKSFITILLFVAILAIPLIQVETVEASPGWINVYSPSNGTNIYTGEQLTISWSSSGINYVKIQLYRSGVVYLTLNSNTSNTGSYTWTIPSGYSSSSSYTVRVSNAENTLEYDESGYFYIKDKSITVNSPTSSSTWFKGETKSITWSSENVGSYFKIQLYKGSSLATTITSSTYKSGTTKYYSWSISSTLSTGSNYRIKITSTSDTAVYDYSDYFAIDERTITLTDPSGGETWYMGQSYTINWDSNNAGSTVTIQYKKSSYYSYTTINSYIANDGSYNWTIPTSLSTGSYTLKIKSNSYSNIYDESSTFTIDERSIDITSPKSWDKWFPNETYDITWDSKNAGSYVEITLYKDDVYTATITSNTENDGSYTWSISDIFAPDSNYQIEIRSKDYSFAYDLSLDFSIGERSILINAPLDIDIWYTGEKKVITWDSEHAGGSVNIDLYIDDKKVREIAKNINNYGSYTWEIPTDLEPGQTYKIKITSVSYSDVYGYSEGTFTIEHTILQKIQMPLIIISLIIVGVIVLISVLKYKKKNRSKNKDDSDMVYPDAYNNTGFQPSSNNEEISQDEYEQIWEK